MSQGRIVYLGYLSSYVNPYRIEVDYVDGAGTPNSYSSSAFSQAPGVIFAIDGLSTITAVRVFDAVTNIVQGQCNSFSATCGSCWPNAPMVGAGTLKIVWDPSVNIVVITDEAFLVPPPEAR
ncbi:MAG: hypothetical protein Q8922_09580 [Bacteroidota bacterium]|nr:hypothetical protein [Bacteroidota bacterium]MDP4234442.1 hypothetical protein [Bacteroidota bacterium]MDP4243976.1 hypothetical protein [Bacteroidota bacterium]MDP4288174.1 hypothetical protein [Bacteroidota bacterium]